MRIPCAVFKSFEWFSWQLNNLSSSRFVSYFFQWKMSIFDNVFDLILHFDFDSILRRQLNQKETFKMKNICLKWHCNSILLNNWVNMLFGLLQRLAPFPCQTSLWTNWWRATLKEVYGKRNTYAVLHLIISILGVDTNSSKFVEYLTFHYEQWTLQVSTTVWCKLAV